MQIKGLHRNIYRLSAYAMRQESLSAAAETRRKQLGDWEMLKARKVPDSEIARITGISRSSYYRHKKALQTFGAIGLEARSRRPKNVRKSRVPQEWRDLVLKLRRANPTYGKAKIHAIMSRDHGINSSESTVGRILSNLMERGLIQRHTAARKSKRRRCFDSHAKRWKYGMRASKPGEMIQIDHMTVTKNNVSFKHFQAWDPITKTVFAELYDNAKAKTAARFLEQLIEKLPFKVSSIQVDGGSEFMRDFEQFCQQRGIPLFVLPPKRPQYNGGVERANRTFREDLYARKDLLAENLGEMRLYLKKALDTYNNYRPHQALDNLTPAQYTDKILRPRESHMY